MLLFYNMLLANYVAPFYRNNILISIMLKTVPKNSVFVNQPNVHSDGASSGRVYSIGCWHS